MFKLQNGKIIPYPIEICDKNENKIVDYIMKYPEEFQDIPEEDIELTLQILYSILCDDENINVNKEVLEIENQTKKEYLEKVRTEIKLILNSGTEKRNQYLELLHFYTKNIELKNIISFEEYLKICEENGYIDEDISLYEANHHDGFRSVKRRI